MRMFSSLNPDREDRKPAAAAMSRIEGKRDAGQKRRVRWESHWRWLATDKFGGYGVRTIWHIEHRRWGIQNELFNVLTNARGMALSQDSVCGRMTFLMNTSGIGSKVRQALITSIGPAVYTCLFLLLMLVWHIAKFPSPERIFEAVSSLYRAHGIWIVGLSAFVEGLVLINLYFPGSAVILIGVITFRGDPIGAASVVVVTMFAFILAANCNYAIGYFGLHNLIKRLGGGPALGKAHRWYEAKGHRAVLLSYWHPNIGAFVAVACGNGRFGYHRFLRFAVIAVFTWNTLWGFLAYHFASLAKETATQPLILLSAFVLWTMSTFSITLIRELRRAV